jgi:hypothetical protein
MKRVLTRLVTLHRVLSVPQAGPAQACVLQCASGRYVGVRETVLMSGAPVTAESGGAAVGT